MSRASASQTAKTMRQLTQVSIPLLIAAIVLPLIGQIYLALFEPAPGAHASAVIAVDIIRAAPALLLAFSLFGLVAVLREYEEGRFFSLASSVALKRVSAGAIIAMLVQIAAAPLLIGIIEGRGDLFIFDTFSLCLLMFAGAMLTVAALLEDAARALKADNDQIV